MVTQKLCKPIVIENNLPGIGKIASVLAGSVAEKAEPGCGDEIEPVNAKPCAPMRSIENRVGKDVVSA